MTSIPAKYDNSAEIERKIWYNMNQKQTVRGFSGHDLRSDGNPEMSCAKKEPFGKICKCVSANFMSVGLFPGQVLTDFFHKSDKTLDGGLGIAVHRDF